MTTDRELMQQALDALDAIPEDVEGYLPDALTDVVIALRARLAQPEQEPVAWMCSGCGGSHSVCPEGNKDVPLYTAPPQREWQRLTDEEIQDMWSDHCKNWQQAEKILISPTVFGRAIEAKLKEKNT